MQLHIFGLPMVMVAALDRGYVLYVVGTVYVKVYKIGRLGDSFYPLVYTVHD